MACGGIRGLRDVFVAVLVGLLVAAYVGSILLARGSQSGLGLASGSEYLLFGFVLGPVVLGVVQRSVISEFDPLVASAAAWLGLTAGQRLAIAEGHTVSPVRVSFGLLAWAAGANITKPQAQQQAMRELIGAAEQNRSGWQAAFKQLRQGLATEAELGAIVDRALHVARCTSRLLRCKMLPAV